VRKDLKKAMGNMEQAEAILLKVFEKEGIPSSAKKIIQEVREVLIDGGVKLAKVCEMR